MLRWSIERHVGLWSCPSISGQAVSLNFERLNSLGD